MDGFACERAEPKRDGGAGADPEAAEGVRGARKSVRWTDFSPERAEPRAASHTLVPPESVAKTGRPM